MKIYPDVEIENIILGYRLEGLIASYSKNAVRHINFNDPRGYRVFWYFYVVWKLTKTPTIDYFIGLRNATNENTDVTVLLKNSVMRFHDKKRIV